MYKVIFEKMRLVLSPTCTEHNIWSNIIIIYMYGLYGGYAYLVTCLQAAGHTEGGWCETQWPWRSFA